MLCNQSSTQTIHDSFFFYSLTNHYEIKLNKLMGLYIIKLL